MNLKFNENYIFLIMFKSLFFFSFKFILVCTCTVNKSYKFDRKTLLLNWERYRFRLISDKALKYFLIFRISLSDREDGVDVDTDKQKNCFEKL